jgi:hypothetical protein
VDTHESPETGVNAGFAAAGHEINRTLLTAHNDKIAAIIFREPGFRYDAIA